jgi:anti-anti-sigma factor
MSSRLQITERAAGDVVIFRLVGDLVYDEGTRTLRQVLTRAVAAGTRKCLLDLEPITYLDSAGVGSLVEMFRHVTRRGGQLKLLRPSASARRVLGITHLTAVFDIFDDEPDALRNLGGPGSASIPRS